MSKKGDKNYKYVQAPTHPRANKHGQMPEHILVMEEKIGRYLNKGEIVHHIDENKLNNSPDNLMLFASNGDHIAYHKGAEIYEKDNVWYAKKRLAFDENGKKIHLEPDKFYTCEYCGKQFNSYRTKSQKIYEHVYCSVECRSNVRRSLPSVEEIILLLHKNNGSYQKTAQQLNMNRKSLYNKVRRSGMPYKKSDYKTYDEHVITSTCPVCGKLFEYEVWRDQKYCSRECSCKANYTTINISELQKELIENNGDYAIVAQKYNLSVAAVKKRLKRAGLPHCKNDYAKAT